MRTTTDHVLRVQHQLTERDWRLLGWLYDHAVLTSFQIAHALFPSLNYAQRRLTQLTELALLERFRPFQLAGGDCGRSGRRLTGFVRGDAWQGSDLVFTTQLGTPVEPRNFNRSWDARIVKAGVPKITPDDGRRTCGTLLADLDVHPRIAMAILRHAQIAITMEIYTQASMKKTRAALKKLSEMFEAEEE